MARDPTGQPVFTVSELNREARLLLEERFNLVWVRGEISNFRRPGSGHWYFTLKDDTGQLSCAMFVNRNRHARVQPTDGTEVILRGRISLYEPRGQYQLLVDAMEPAGEGALRAAFEALRERLAGEGLFAVERKRQLPRIPTHLAIISSPSGAALRDVVAVISRRFPACRVTVLPVAVQGSEAEAQINAAFARLRDWPATVTPPDIVLLTRGGGSLEDLWAFNLESVARSVAASPVPTVVAVGHETDFTIAEFVADLRGPTPSAAAELLTPDRDELEADLLRRERSLQRAFGHRLQIEAHRVGSLRARLRDPRDRLQQLAQRTDELEGRVQRATTLAITARRARLAAAMQRLVAARPERRLASARLEVQRQRERLTRITGARLLEARGRVDTLARMLGAVSPRQLMERGWTILETPGATPVTSAAEVTVGARLRASLHDGALNVVVEGTAPLRGVLRDDAIDTPDTGNRA